MRQTYQMLNREVLRDTSFLDETALEGTDTADDQLPVAAAVPRVCIPEKVEKPTKLFERLLQLMVSVMEEDKVHYSPCFSQ